MRNLNSVKPLLVIFMLSCLTGAHAQSQSDSVSAAQAATLKLIESCSFPPPPALLDGSIASNAEMEAMGNEVRAYATTMQASLACLDEADDGVSSEEQKLIDYVYNNGVDQLNFVVTGFNDQLEQRRRFKGFDIP